MAARITRLVPSTLTFHDCSSEYAAPSNAAVWITVSTPSSAADHDSGLVMSPAITSLNFPARLRPAADVRWVPDPAGCDHDRHVEAAASAVGWLLNRVGEQGIRLTAAGYLPPKVVTAAMDELGWRAKWIGSCTREDTTAPILETPRNRSATQTAAQISRPAVAHQNRCRPS